MADEPIDAEYAFAIEGSRHFIPSPAEITATCADIRNGWSDDERDKRHIGKRPALVDENRQHKVVFGE